MIEVSFDPAIKIFVNPFGFLCEYSCAFMYVILLDKESKIFILNILFVICIKKPTTPFTFPSYPIEQNITLKLIDIIHKS